MYLVFPHGYHASYIPRDWPFEPDPAKQCGHRAPDGLLVCTLNDNKHGLSDDQHVAHDPQNHSSTLGEWDTNDPLGIVTQIRDTQGNILNAMPRNRMVNVNITNPHPQAGVAAPAGVQGNARQAGYGQITAKKAFDPAVQGSDSIEEWDLLPDPTIEESQRLLTWEELNEKDHEKILGHKRRVQ